MGTLTQLQQAAFWGFQRQDEWDRWFTAIAPYLTDPDPKRRDSSVERMLCAARCEKSPTRYQWLFEQFYAARERPGMTGVILRHLRWHWPHETLEAPARAWLENLPAEWQAMARAATMLNSHFDEEHLNDLLSLLDDESDYLRAAAAHCLGDLNPPKHELRHLIDRISRAELDRAGVAGPFWSALQFAPPTPEVLTPREWMLDLLEQRQGAYPDLWWFNDIDFHLHEICSHHPADVMRMIANGRHDLALMTATEEERPIPGMEQPLLQLGQNTSTGTAAQAHLACHYGILHPDASPDLISHFPNWQPDAALFLIGPADRPRMGAIHAAAPLSDARAWELADMLAPPETRGPRQPSHTDGSPLPSQVDFPVTDTETHNFGSGHAILMCGDRNTRRWQRIRLWQVTRPPHPLPPAATSA